MKAVNRFLQAGFARVHSTLQAMRSAPPAEYLQVTNATRQTVLASYVKVADHGATRRKGLLGRKGLGQGEGLWIVPCESVHTIGMQFSIDLVYLDRNRTVKKVVCDVPRWRLSACFSAHSVLELAAGSVSPTQTKPGDQLEFSPVASPSNRPLDGD
jgi:uncharacterized membrane protein (UPF0127 family)